MIVLDREEMRRTGMRLSMEIIEKNKGADDLVLVGIRPRGVILAKKMRREIERIEGVTLPLGTLDIARHRDDLSEHEREAEFSGSEIDFSLEGKSVALIDDIMYTGRTARAAVSALLELGTPRTVRLYTLIDRGHRELPFRPDSAGKTIPTSSEEIIKVHFKETDGDDLVILTR